MGEHFHSQLQLTSAAPKPRAPLPIRGTSHLHPPCCETAAPRARERREVLGSDGNLMAVEANRMNSEGRLPGRRRKALKPKH